MRKLVIPPALVTRSASRSTEGRDIRGKDPPVRVATEPTLSCSVAPIRFPLFFGGCPTEMVQAPKRVPFFPGSLNN